MATRGRGPTPKLGEKLGHTASDRRVTRPGDGRRKDWPIPAGEWLPQTVAWWEASLGSVAAEVAWTDEDRPKVERLLHMVDAWWRLMLEDPVKALQQHDVIRRAEVELYLGPAERARAGMVRKDDAPDRPVVSRARARLRAVDDAVG